MIFSGPSELGFMAPIIRTLVRQSSALERPMH